MKYVYITLWAIICINIIPTYNFAQIPVMDTMPSDDTITETSMKAVVPISDIQIPTPAPTLQQRIKVKLWNDDYIYTKYRIPAAAIIEPYQLKKPSKRPIQSITEQYYTIKGTDTIKKYGDGLNTRIELDSLGRFTAIYIKESGAQGQDTFHLITTYHYKGDKLDHKRFYEFYGGALSYNQWYMYDINGNLVNQYLISYDTNQILEYKGVKYKYTYLSYFSYIEEQYEDDIDSNFYLTQMRVVHLDTLHRKTLEEITDYDEDSTQKSIKYTYEGNTETIQYNFPSDISIRTYEYNVQGDIIASKYNDNSPWNDNISQYTYDAYGNWVTQLNITNTDSTGDKTYELIRRTIIYFP